MLGTSCENMKLQKEKRRPSYADEIGSAKAQPSFHPMTTALSKRRRHLCEPRRRTELASASLDTWISCTDRESRNGRGRVFSIALPASRL